MAEIDYIMELRKDHDWIIDNLIILKALVARNDIASAREIVELLDKVAGPHFFFEEKILYPALRTLGGDNVDDMLGEHEGAINVVNTLNELFLKDALSDDDRKAVGTAISELFSHALKCDGVALLAKRIKGKQHRELAKKFQEAKATGKPLTVWTRGKN